MKIRDPERQTWSASCFSCIEGSFYLYVLHETFVAEVLLGNDPSCGVYIGNNIQEDLSLGICNGEGCDGNCYSIFGQEIRRASRVWALTATLVSKD